MIWFTLRQFRAYAWVTLGAFAVGGVVLTITGIQMADLYAESGLATCQSACEPLVSTFLARAEPGVNAAALVLYAVPALIGLFWGAPLIARELEAGTHRLVWNQSITRTRWLATKLATIGLAAIATTGVLTLAVSVWAHRFDQTAMGQVTPFFFGARGVVPMAYAAFGFVLGVTAGLLIRRTVPAMAATLVVYVAAIVVMPLWLRARLAPTAQVTRPLDLDNLYGLMITHAGPMTVTGAADMPGAWVVSNLTITQTGDTFTGPAHEQFCGPDAPFRDCRGWLETLDLRQHITYHPADHFWPLQFAESGIFLAAALLLAGFSFWWLRRRIA